MANLYADEDFRHETVDCLKQSAVHAEIIACSQDDDYERLAGRINEAIAENEPLAGKLIRVRRPTR